LPLSVGRLLAARRKVMLSVLQQMQGQHCEPYRHNHVR
jgi:hypothetical protein